MRSEYPESDVVQKVWLVLPVTVRSLQARAGKAGNLPSTNVNVSQTPRNMGLRAVNLGFSDRL
jgi:hypothetical protein